MTYSIKRTTPIWSKSEHFCCVSNTTKMLLYKGFEKFVDPSPILTYILRTKHLTNMVLLTFLFLMVSGTIWYATWHRSFWYIYTHWGGHFEEKKSPSMEKVIGFWNKHPDCFWYPWCQEQYNQGWLHNREMATKYPLEPGLINNLEFILYNLNLQLMCGASPYCNM